MNGSYMSYPLNEEGIVSVIVEGGITFVLNNLSNGGMSSVPVRHVERGVACES